MESTIQGRVYKFGDNINSDIIIPGRYLIYIDRERLAQHAFEVLGEGFPAKLHEFQILVAGGISGVAARVSRRRPRSKGSASRPWLRAPSHARFIATPLTTACRSSNARNYIRMCRKVTR